MIILILVIVAVAIAMGACAIGIGVEFPPHDWRKEYPEKYTVVRRCRICGRQDVKHVLLGEWEHEAGPLQCKMERDWTL